MAEHSRTTAERGLMSWFYDNGDEVSARGGDELVLAVDRVYCLRLDAFGAEEWATLGRIYRELPGWRADATDLARWFALDEDAIPHLSASVEPGGLYVEGWVGAATWRDWDERFRAAVETARLPIFTP